MKTMKTFQVTLFVAVVTFICSSVQAFAEDTTAFLNNAEKIMMESTRVLNDAVAKKTELNIPPSALENAVGVAIFPKKIEREHATGVGYEKGVVLIRQKNNEWSSPLFVNLSFSGPGRDIREGDHDLLLVFLHKEELKELADGNNTTVAPYEGITTTRLTPGAASNGNYLYISKDLTVAYYTQNTPEDQKGGRGYYAKDKDYYRDETKLYNEVLEGNVMGTSESANRLKEALNSYIAMEK